MKRFLLLTFFFGIIAIAFSQKEQLKKVSKKSQVQYQDGDIIFQSSMSGQSQAIQLATHSKYSHVGLLFEQDGKWMVYEAVQPVCVTPLSAWIHRGDNDHFVVKRLKNSNELLTEKNLFEMREYGKQFLGKDYDIYFGWGDDLIYCSELVWKIYNEVLGIQLCELQRLKEFDFSHPVVQAIAKERYGNNIPETEMAISPGAIFNSNKLKTVVSKNKI